MSDNSSREDYPSIESLRANVVMNARNGDDPVQDVHPIGVAPTVTPQNTVLPINKDPYANPTDTIRRMRRYSPCFTKAFDRGQQVFVLVEQDATAYKAIAQWINNNIDRLGKDHPKIIAAKTTMMIFMQGYDGLHKKMPD